MQIKPFKDYDQTQAYAEYKQLPKGGYVLKVLGVEVKENSRGQYIQLGCDIAEGDYKNFYTQEWHGQNSEDKKWHCNYLLNIPTEDGSEQDGWTKRRFKTVIQAFEASNEGFHWAWDTDALKGKMIGGLFNIREYYGKDNTVRQATNLAQLVAVDSIRDGSYRLPNDKLLNQGAVAPANATEEWMSLPDTDADALPFA